MDTSQHDLASLEGVLALLWSGPLEVAQIEGLALLRDDDQRLSYSTGDRELQRRYRPFDLASLSFPAVPLTPFRELQQYFEEPIPYALLEEERARSMTGIFRMPFPSRLRELERSFEAAQDGAQQARLALELAALYDGPKYKARALGWVKRALDVHPTLGEPEALDRARRIAGNAVGVFAGEIRAWLQSLPEDARQSPVAHAMTEVLRAHESREAQRRAAYLWE